MKKPKLVAPLREAWRWHSMRILAFIAALPVVWANLPPETKQLLSELVPAQYHAWVITVVALAGMWFRLRPQSPQPPQSPERGE